ncbi:MAG: hypothetical protein AAGF92_16510 [Myxococcota bacterium]
MTVRLVLGLLVVWGSMGCNDRVAVGSSCFDTQECKSGSVCTETVYGNLCLETCEADTVRCEDFEACVEGAVFEAAGGAGGSGNGTGGEGGAGGVGGVGTPTDFFVCLPGQALDVEDFEPVLIGGLCTVSLDCELGGFCVCLEGANCDLDDSERDGPVCVEICDPSTVSRCPAQQVCVDLGNGRGFCDMNSGTPPMSAEPGN